MLPLILAAAVAISVPDTAAAQLAQALQKKYDGIKDFSADFVHTYQGGVLTSKSPSGDAC